MTTPVKPDRRTQRTRQALMTAFVDLMLERGYEAVSVADVVERANIGRSTFYVHFAGIEGILKQSLAFPSSRLLPLTDGTATPESLASILEHVRGQRRINKVFFGHPVRAFWARCLAEMIEARLAARSRAARPAATHLPLGFVAQQIAEGQIALIANWLSSRSPAPIPLIAQALIATTNANLATLWAPAPVEAIATS